MTVATSMGISNPIVVSRPLSVRLVGAVFAVMFGLLAAAIIAGALPGAYGEIGFTLAFLATPVAVVRAFRVSLVADEHEIVVRNYFTTYKLKWEEVKHVGIGVHHFGAQLSAVAFKRRGKGAWVTSRATTTGERECRRVIRALAAIRTDLPITFSE